MCNFSWCLFGILRIDELDLTWPLFHLVSKQGNDLSTISSNVHPYRLMYMQLDMNVVSKGGCIICSTAEHSSTVQTGPVPQYSTSLGQTSTECSTVQDLTGPVPKVVLVLAGLGRLPGNGTTPGHPPHYSRPGLRHLSTLDFLPSALHLHLHLHLPSHTTGPTIESPPKKLRLHTFPPLLFPTSLSPQQHAPAVGSLAWCLAARGRGGIGSRYLRLRLHLDTPTYTGYSNLPCLRLSNLTCLHHHIPQTFTQLSTLNLFFPLIDDCDTNGIALLGVLLLESFALFQLIRTAATLPEKGLVARSGL